MEGYEKLEKALGLISRRGGWTQGTEGKTKRSIGGFLRGEHIEHLDDVEAYYAVDNMSYCAIGSVYAICGPGGEKEAEELISALNAETMAYYPDVESIIELNDGDVPRTKTPSVARKKVQEIFQATIRKMKAKAGIPIEIPDAIEATKEQGKELVA